MGAARLENFAHISLGMPGAARAVATKPTREASSEPVSSTDQWNQGFEFVIARSSCHEAIQSVLATPGLLRLQTALRAILGSQ
jgi:hypothetical protein